MHLQMKRILPLLMLISASIGCNAESKVIDVKVYDPKFELIKTIKNSDDIDTLLVLWSDAEVSSDLKIGPLDRLEFYKVDYETENKTLSGRWLYLKSGYYRRLSKAHMETYKVKNVGALNKALGI